MKTPEGRIVPHSTQAFPTLTTHSLVRLSSQSKRALFLWNIRQKPVETPFYPVVFFSVGVILVSFEGYLCPDLSRPESIEPTTPSPGTQV
jgi:hypothetical protein